MDPIPTDFWGVVVPAWLGSVGSIAASAVAVFAYINSRSARGGVKEMRGSVNQSTPTIYRTAVGSLNLAGSATAVVVEPWAFEDEGNKATFRNTSGETLTVASASATGGIDLTLREQFPLEVPPTASFDLNIHRVLGGPAVVGVTLDWTREDGAQLSRTYYL